MVQPLSDQEDENALYDECEEVNANIGINAMEELKEPLVDEEQKIDKKKKAKVPKK